MTERTEAFRILATDRHRLKVDGKGVTTLVGLAGCPLRCAYCINQKLLARKKPRSVTPEELLEEVMQDYCYFIATGGGVTFGGGEPLLQYRQLKRFGELLPQGVALNIETSLNADQENVLALMQRVDEWIIDIKDMDPAVYEQYTGVEQAKVISNLRLLADRGLQHRCTIRIPSIPNYNSRADVEHSIKFVQDMGFYHLDTFDYILKDQ